MEFVAGVSHELRTPIAVIRSAAENLSHGVVGGSDRVKQYGQVMEGEARRLGEMVESVLQYAGVESGRGLGPQTLIAPADLIDQAVDSARISASSTADVERSIPADLPAVIGDQAALTSAVQNLIVNAFKYGGDAQWVGVRAAQVTRGRKTEVQITVEDRGPGIPADELPHIFEPFYRGAEAVGQQIHGNGLGLSLVQRIVRAHGGTVTVRTRDAGGTAFTIVLPAAAAELKPTSLADGAASLAEARLARHRALPRLLLVEDELGLVMTLTDRLESEGFTVESARDAKSGLQLATEERFDMILLDVMLPGGSGLDICRTIRQKGIQTPVVMLTARGQVVDRVVGLKLGADDYLVKPFEMAELLARIEAVSRRTRPTPSPSTTESFQTADLRMDFRRAEVSKNGTLLALSAREYKLLRYFVEHRGATLSRDELLNEVWGYNAMPSTRTVDVHVAWLRQKIEDNPRHPKHILTVHGLGYKFAD